ncbi:MAG: c-type cytochrome [Burkholderiales bacterium]
MAALAAMACVAAPVGAQEPGFRGVDIFDSACYACHTEGIDGAPRIGDRAAWSARAEKGLDALTESALKGVRGMPPHGGNSSLTRLQLERAIVYMVNASGGDWVEPPDPRPAGSERSGAQVYQQHCALCHATGFDNAPRIGDRTAWLPYTKLGLDPMVRTAIRGHGAMQRQPDRRRTARRRDLHDQRGRHARREGGQDRRQALSPRLSRAQRVMPPSTLITAPLM